jgi:hypothetical protein
MREAVQQSGTRGLSDPSLQGSLERGHYIPVVTAVWSESDPQRRVEWLRANAGLHAPLLFEQALAECEAIPTVETVNRVALPGIAAATLRMGQDAACSLDLSTSAGIELMQMTYTISLAQLIRERLGGQALGAVQDPIVVRPAIKEAVARMAERTLSGEPLPDPTWAAWHGTDVQISGVPRMRPAREHERIRRELAERIIREN